jgi:CMP-N-acetylneuraminic acid synthetase
MNYAFIPARSGSNRLKNKNILEFNGIPLIGWTLKAAMDSKLIDKVIFSSDSNEYVDLAFSLVKNYDKELLIDLRQKSHASDETKIFDYLKSELLKKFLFDDQDLIVQLLPTCPLRREKHIDEAITLSSKFKTGVFAACEYDFHISFAFEPKGNGDWIPLVEESPMITGNTQSQSQKKYMHTNGSINCLPVNLLKKNKKSIYQGSKYYVMDRISSIDIDDHDDFILAEIISKNFNTI